MIDSDTPAKNPEIEAEMQANALSAALANQVNIEAYELVANEPHSLNASRDHGAISTRNEATGIDQDIVAVIRAGDDHFALSQVTEIDNPRRSDYVLTRFGKNGERATIIGVLSPDEELPVGRSHQPDLDLSDTISRNHFTVKLSGHRKIDVTDNGSSNGTELFVVEDYTKLNAKPHDEAQFGVRALEKYYKENEFGVLRTRYRHNLAIPNPLKNFALWSASSTDTKAAIQADNARLDAARLAVRNQTTQSIQPQINEGSKAEKIQTNIESGLAERALKGQDKALVDDANQVYAVFDGMGGYGGGEEAADAAKLVFAEAAQKLQEETDPDKSAKLLVELMREANKSVSQIEGNGGTTAVVAHVIENETGRYLSWVSVGDSRLYIRSGDSIRMITEDEGEANSLNNALGSDSTHGREYLSYINQFGHEALKAGDELILVSDGITGDRGDELLSDNEILEATRSAQSAKQAADKLLEISRKQDDKTALVIRL